MPQRRILKTGALTLLGIVIFGAGMYTGIETLGDISEKKCRDRFTFINADVVCEDQEAYISKAPYLGLQSEIHTYIEQKKMQGAITEASVYFRDLRNGPVFGVDENARFIPASLLKVPLALVLLREEDEHGRILERQLQFSDDIRLKFESGENTSPTTLVRAFKSHADLTPNTPYTIEELSQRMISYSDNLAYSVLVTHVFESLGGETYLREAFEGLGIVDPTFADDMLSVRTYASLFRLLYHTSYLSPESSEKMLQWLSASDFDAGIVAGIPTGVRVAHKYGERQLTDRMQLHDCGIVYFHEHNPYLLCVMTKGHDMNNLATCIADISRMVYKEVDSRHLY